jgi:hypothetical protein
MEDNKGPAEMFHVTDNAVSSSLINAALMQFPEPDWHRWYVWDTWHSKKKGTKCPQDLPPVFTLLLQEMVLAIEQYTEMTYESGPDFDLHGAGLSLLEPEGFINTHTDAESHPTRNWRRTHSAILYLDTCESGYTTLNDAEGYNTLTAVTPVRNRILIFETEKQFHGVTTCHELRRTLNLFYWQSEPETERSELQKSEFTKERPVLDHDTKII